MPSSKRPRSRCVTDLLALEIESPAQPFQAINRLITKSSQRFDDVQGALPKDLVGTLYRNGAGRIRVGDHLRYGHWFDGACTDDTAAAAAAAPASNCAMMATAGWFGHAIT